MSVRDLIVRNYGVDTPIKGVSSWLLGYMYPNDSLFGSELIITYSPSLNHLVVIGQNSRFSYSTDGGVSWNNSPALFYAVGDFQNFGPGYGSLIWTGSSFLVGNSNSSFLYRSTDGVNWSKLSGAGAGNNIASICGISSKLFMYHGLGKFSVSTDDGLTWTTNSNLANNTTFQSHQPGGFTLGFGDSLTTPMLTFIYEDMNVSEAATGYPITRMWSSPDGSTWTSRTSPIGYGDPGQLISGPGKLVLVAGKSNGQSGLSGGMNTFVAYSTNGTSFTAGSAPTGVTPASGFLRNGCYDTIRSRYVTGTYFSEGLFTDSDGVGTWTKVDSVSTGGYNQLTYSSSYGFVNARQAVIIYSATGLTNSYSSSDSYTNLPARGSTGDTTGMAKRISGSTTTIVAVGTGCTLVSTTNGLSWWGYSSGKFEGTSVVYGDKFVAGSRYGYIYTSNTGGNDWTPQTSLRNSTWGTSAYVYDIAWNGSIYCAVGGIPSNGEGQAATSNDGITWTHRPDVNNSIGSWTVDKVTWNGSVFCLLSRGGYCMTSPDGTSWTNNGTISGFSGTWNSLVSDTKTGKMVATNNTNIFVSNNNGSTWTKLNSPSGDIGSAVFDGTKFVLTVGANIYKSYDASNWQSVGVTIANKRGTIISSLFTGNRFLFADNNGGLYYTT